MPNDNTRTLVIRQVDDGDHDIYLDGAFIASVSHDEHGMSGTEGVIETTTKIAKAFGAEVITEDVR